MPCNCQITVQSTLHGVHVTCTVALQQQQRPISAVLVGNTNDQYPNRPSEVVRIDLDHYLHIVRNATAVVTARDTIVATTDEDKQSKTEPEPMNPVVNHIPTGRFSLWSELTKTEKEYATRLLNYNEATWDHPMTNPIEMQPFHQLPQQMKGGLSALRISPSQWDCHVNHYYGYYWDRLMKVGMHIHFEKLGWTQESWDYGNATSPEVESMTWKELDKTQKEIARELCYYNRETWDELPLSTWLVEWRKMNGRKFSSAYHQYEGEYSATLVYVN